MGGEIEGLDVEDASRSSKLEDSVMAKDSQLLYDMVCRNVEMLINLKSSFEACLFLVKGFSRVISFCPHYEVGMPADEQYSRKQMCIRAVSHNEPQRSSV